MQIAAQLVVLASEALEMWRRSWLEADLVVSREQHACAPKESKSKGIVLMGMTYRLAPDEDVEKWRAIADLSLSACGENAQVDNQRGQRQVAIARRCVAGLCHALVPNCSVRRGLRRDP